MSRAYLRWSGFAIVAFGLGCTSQGADNDTSDQEPPDPDVFTSTEPQPPAEPAAACPAAPAAWRLEMGPGTRVLSTSLAVDGRNNVYYSQGSGVLKLSPDGVLRYARTFGMAVTADRAGNAYIAGSFSAPIDIGLGIIDPEGRVDVLVAKLDPAGNPIFAKALHRCSEGSVQSIAVDVSGWIAVSGPGIGTVVLARNGRVQFARDFWGDVAFDSKRNLVVAGGFSGAIDFGQGHSATNGGDSDAFLVKLDFQGTYVYSAIIGDPALPFTLFHSGHVVTTPTDQFGTAVAVDREDNVIMLGRFVYGANVFGETLKAVDLSGLDVADWLHSGGFLVKLDPRGALLFEFGLYDLAAVTDVAVDAQANIYVAGASYANARPPFRYAFLSEYDRTGQFVAAAPPEFGIAHGVVVDHCGSVISSASLQPGGIDTFRTYLVKQSR